MLIFDKQIQQNFIAISHDFFVHTGIEINVKSYSTR